jgi:hypothetical protein
MREFLMSHQVIIAVGLFFLYSNAVQALPAPTEKSSGFYRWLFAFSHGLAGNLKYALQKAMPQYVAPERQ